MALTTRVPNVGCPGHPGGQGRALALSRPSLATSRRCCACLVALRVPAGAGVWKPARAGLWRVADAAARIGQQLDAAPGGGGAALGAFLPRIGPAVPERELRCRAAVASTLLAGLELARDGGVLLEQDRPWTAIQVQQRRADDLDLDACDGAAA